MDIKANVAFDIPKLPVMNLSGSIKVTGTIYVLLQKAASDAVWSTDGGGTWETRANATLPEATLVTSGETWGWQMPAAANNLADVTRLSLTLIDNLTPASITAMSPTLALTVRTDNPAIVGSAMDVASISGDATAADNAEAFFDGTGYAGTNNVIPSVTNVTGDVQGKVLGGGAGTITGTGVRAVDGSGNAIMAAASYTAPDNAGIAAIKVQTDLLPAEPAAVGDAGASLGLFQIWTGWFFEGEDPMNPLTSARVALRIREIRGRFGGGGGWTCAGLLGIE